MIEPTEKTNSISLQPKITMDINKQMQARDRRKATNINLSDIKKMQPLSFIVVTDPHTRTRSFATVDFSGMGFLLFEQSIDKMPNEKGITIGQRYLMDLYEINLLSKVEVANIIQDKDLGAVFLKSHEQIRKTTEEKYGVSMDSTLTTLNVMLALNLVESENPEADSIEHCRQIAREITDEAIEKTVAFVLRKREARYMIERELIAASI